MEDNPQKAHYETIHNDYTQHYYDDTSMQYRFKFIYNRLFNNIDLNNKSVADIACGNGSNSVALLSIFPDAKVTGFDISKNACEDYIKNLKMPAYEVDLTQSNEFEHQYDCVMVVGGIHNCIKDLPKTFENIYKLLKPGGILLMFEPNKKYFLEPIRKVWYKLDKYFEENTEEALDHKELILREKNRFEEISVSYFGGQAYFLILNSLLFRLPLWLKPPLTSILLVFEKIYNCFR